MNNIYRSINSIFLIFCFFGFTFIMFQNFHESSLSGVCVAYFVDPYPDQSRNPFMGTAVELGQSEKKSECLKKVVEEIKVHGCPGNRSQVQVALWDQILPEDALNKNILRKIISLKDFVADFDCRSITTQLSGSEPLSSNIHNIQIDYGARFAEIAQQTLPKEEILTLEDFSIFCPGCFRKIEHREVASVSEVCHEFKPLEEILQAGYEDELKLVYGGKSEFQCDLKTK